MTSRLLDAVEVKLPGREIGQGIKAPSEHIVREFVDHRGCLVAVLLGSTETCHCRCGGAYRQSGAHQRLVGERRGAAHRFRRPPFHRFVIGGEQPVDSQRDHQRDGVRALAVGELVQRRLQPRMRLPVMPGLVLDNGAGNSQLQAQRVSIRRDDCQSLDQGRVALRKESRGRKKLRSVQQQLDTFLGRRVLWQQS